MGGRDPVVFELDERVFRDGSGSSKLGGTLEGGRAFGDSVTDRRLMSEDF